MIPYWFLADCRANTQALRAPWLREPLQCQVGVVRCVPLHVPVRDFMRLSCASQHCCLLLSPRTLEFLPTRVWAKAAQTLVGKHSRVLSPRTLELLPTRVWAKAAQTLVGKNSRPLLLPLPSSLLLSASAAGGAAAAAATGSLSLQLLLDVAAASAAAKAAAATGLLSLSFWLRKSPGSCPFPGDLIGHTCCSPSRFAEAAWGPWSRHSHCRCSARFAGAAAWGPYWSHSLALFCPVFKKEAAWGPYWSHPNCCCSARFARAAAWGPLWLHTHRHCSARFARAFGHTQCRCSARFAPSGFATPSAHARSRVTGSTFRAPGRFRKVLQIWVPLCRRARRANQSSILMG